MMGGMDVWMWITIVASVVATVLSLITIAFTSLRGGGRQ